MFRYPIPREGMGKGIMAEISDIEIASLFTAHLETIVKAKAFGHVLHLRGINDETECDNFATACDDFAMALIDHMFPGTTDDEMTLRIETVEAYHGMWEALREMTFG